MIAPRLAQGVAINAVSGELPRRAQRRAIWALAYVVGLLVVLAIVPVITASRAPVHRRLSADSIGWRVPLGTTR